MYRCFYLLNFAALLASAYDIKYTDTTVSLSPFPMDVGRNVFYGRYSWPDNEYYKTYTQDPDVGRTTEEYILSRHFKCETHYVTTEDGYILPAYRIINPFNKDKKPYPIIFSVSSYLDVNQWLWNYGGNAVPPKDPAKVKEGQILNSNLPYALSNHGYDVWLFNIRGTGSYLNHTRLSIYSSEYWKFSEDESIEYDVPAVIKYIQSATRHKKVGYVGYSESSLLILMAMASHTKLNEVVKPAILMGFGVVPDEDINTDPVSMLLGNTLNQVALPVLPKMKLTSTVLTAFCSPPIQDACAILLQLVVGFDPENLNKTRFPVYISQVPAGSNTWKTAQGLQKMPKNCFPKFSYGPLENRRKYGQDEPPCYNLSRVTNRFIGAFIGNNDQVTPYSENTLSLLGDVGRNVLYGRNGWPDNDYYDTYSQDPDVGRTTEEYILSRHFKCETHYVTTDDGYILPAYRIVNPFNKDKKPYPIIFSTSSSLDVNQWLWNYGGNAVPPKDPARVKEGQILNSNLPYALSNHGYDVWLFNTRGIGSYLNHTHLSIYSSEYWRFSEDEITEYDIPAAIKYIQSATKHS
ncbi:Lipase member K [Halotydeus destructor]|nr:Lipase member K [Halotydeus destructor]